jgi:hypothetical protein
LNNDSDFDLITIDIFGFAVGFDSLRIDGIMTLYDLLYQFFFGDKKIGIKLSSETIIYSIFFGST